MKLTFETVHAKGLEVGWSGLSFQEHAVLLFHKVNESVLEKERDKGNDHAQKVTRLGQKGS